MRRLRARGPRSDKPASRPKPDAIGETSESFPSGELREFLEADELGVEADPAFKERLRRKLWDLIRARLADRPKKSLCDDDSDA